MIKLKEDISIVEELVNKLIKSLYKPVKEEMIYKVDRLRVKEFGIDDTEPINWGDLKCFDVKKFEDGSYLVSIDEAGHNFCPTFCGYIESFMKSWEWVVSVETEW
jgi:hypothetical protein